MNALSTPIADPCQETVLAVPAMHCAGCMSKIERGLAQVDAVQSARVNLSSRLVRVSHSPSLNERELVLALADIGFEAQPRSAAVSRPVSAVKPLLAPLAVAGFAAMNVMLLSVSVWSGADGSTRSMFHWLSALIAVPAIAYAGQPFFRSAWAALRNKSTNMDVPISIGVIIASGLSVYETITGGQHAWFDGALMLLTFLLAGRVLDGMMRDRARTGVDALLSQAASGAMVVTDTGAAEWVKTDDLRTGMVMRVASGERLAADGEIITGRTSFDRSLLTGETTPVIASSGDAVLAGTLNLGDPVDVRVTQVGHDTTLSEIARLMEASTQNRSKYVRIADRASRLYAPAVHTLAALTVIGWLLAGATVYDALVIGVAVLIITCPCALGLAVPVAQVVASGALMRAGVMVKDGSAIERLAAVDRALLDKTGTLTQGKPVPDPAAIAALPARDAAIALSLASHSRHPLSGALAQALTQTLAGRGIEPVTIGSVSEVAGQGVFGMLGDQKVALRRPDVADGTTVVFQNGNQPERLIGFADRLRPDTVEALAQMVQLGVEPSILSGDNCSSVRSVALETGLMGQANTTPAQKQSTIDNLRATGRTVLMAGDGLNDGPALAAANASIAPGSASDVGLHAADFVFMQSSLLAVPRAIRVSRRTMRVVRQNFALAIGYNVLAVPLAIAGVVTPLIAAVAMSASSLIVVANSLRLVRAAK